jgi:carbamoyl-phosphate synthase large subunit
MPSALVVDSSTGPALAVARSLARRGWRVLVPAGTRAAASRFAAAAVAVPAAEVDPPGFVRSLGAVLESEPVDVVVPALDASLELLWANEEILRGAAILGGDRRSFELATDKARALEAADAAGFGTPEWILPATTGEAEAALDRIGLPCVVKPRRSWAAVGGRLVHRRHVFVRRREELEPALRLQAMPDGSLPIVQAFVPGRSLLVSFVVRSGRVLARVAWETLSFDPIIGGTSVWKRTVRLDDDGVQDALAFVRGLGYEGFGTIEYQVPADGRARLMEIGARVHASLSLDVAAGVDVPWIAVRALRGEELPDAPPYRVGVEMRWLPGEIGRVRRVLRRQLDLPPGVSRWDVLSRAWPPWRLGMHYDGVLRDDLRPWLPARLRNRNAR